MFGKAARAMSGSPSEEADRARKKQQEHDTLERLAREAEPAALAKHDEMLSACLAEHARQTEGYHFDCTRFGDFLTVYIKRLGNPDKPRIIDEGPGHYTSPIPERIFSTTLNLGKTVQMAFTAGSPADDAGELHYIGTSGNARLTIEEIKAGEKLPLHVDPSYPNLPYDRKIFYLEPPPQPAQQGVISSGYWQEPSYEIKFTTKPWPRVAMDDEIIFVGIGAHLYVPAGLGEGVQARILTEMAKNG